MAQVKIEIDPSIDPVSYIFDILFDCKARLVDLTPDEDLKDYGTYHTGMSMMDDANMTQLVPCCLSIAQIATHMDKGFEIRFTHPVDVLKMYEFAQNLLMKWANMLGNQSLNADNAPIEDLLKLDRFTSVIYEQAKFYDAPKLTSIEQRFGNTMSFGSILSMFGQDKRNEAARLDTLKTSHRKGFSELFLEHQMRTDPSLGMEMGLDIFGKGLNDRK
jgi:hypothetical protein